MNANPEILETDKGVAEKIKLVPPPGTRMFREWVYEQIHNSGLPAYYVGKISKLFLDESRPRVSAKGLLEDALDQRNYLARLFLDSRLKAKLEKEIKRAEKEILKSVKTKADENVVNNQAQEDHIFRRASARKELADYCDKMRTELHESEKKMKKPDSKTSEDQMFCGLKNISENYEGEVNNYALLGPSQRQAILDQILQCAEDEAKRAEDEAKSAPIDSGLIVFEERLSIIIENVKQHLDEEKKTRMDFIENANIQINYLKCALEMLQDKIKLLKELDTSLIAMCQDADHLIIYERLLEDLD
jgi:hypothetical protein